MSRIGFKPVVLPEGVTAEIKAGLVTVKGPKGELSVVIPNNVSVEEKGRSNRPRIAWYHQSQLT